ncbi:hypothetical protein LP420_24115 [Massilia sp. B-10]|nr:hypothetical protein LP420_24115 [Massilia sp. B-10]
MPYAMFCLMPLFALYLKLLYLGSGRRYGEHLLFALHSNAFAFAMFGLMIMARRPEPGSDRVPDGAVAGDLLAAGHAARVRRLCTGRPACAGSCWSPPTC